MEAAMLAGAVSGVQAPVRAAARVLCTALVWPAQTSQTCILKGPYCCLAARQQACLPWPGLPPSRRQTWRCLPTLLRRTTRRPSKRRRHPLPKAPTRLQRAQWRWLQQRAGPQWRLPKLWPPPQVGEGDWTAGRVGMLWFCELLHLRAARGSHN